MLVTMDSEAQEAHVAMVQPPIKFLAIDSGETDVKVEMSAVAPIGDGTLLLMADDENKNLLVVEAATGKLKQTLTVKGVEKKPKWEAMAIDAEGDYYIISAHSVKDPNEADAQAKLKARSRLFHFRLKGGTDGAPLIIDESSIIEWDVTDALRAEGYDPDPHKNRVKIEGLAVRTLRDPVKNTMVRELVIGLREPTEPVSVLTADITQLPAAGAKLALKPLFKFSAGKREEVSSKLSSIEYVRAWNGFLILTSTEDASNAFHGNTLWFLSDEKISAALSTSPLKLVEPQKVWLFGIASKAEGMCVLSEEAVSKSPQNRQARIALVYDNDTEKTGAPGAMQVITLTLWPK
jgi:hypothetical protein